MELTPFQHYKPLTNLTDKRKKWLLYAYKTHEGNISRACNEADVSRVTYYKWMQEDTNFARQIEELNRQFFPTAHEESDKYDGIKELDKLDDNKKDNLQFLPTIKNTHLDEAKETDLHFFGTDKKEETSPTARQNLIDSMEVESSTHSKQNFVDPSQETGTPPRQNMVDSTELHKKEDFQDALENTRKAIDQRKENAMLQSATGTSKPPEEKIVSDNWRIGE